jgi:hypothetical protein
VVLPELELLGVFDRDDAFFVRDERRQNVQQRRLAGAGTAGDDDVEAAANRRVNEVRDLRRDRTERDQVADCSYWVIMPT